MSMQPAPQPEPTGTTIQPEKSTNPKQTTHHAHVSEVSNLMSSELQHAVRIEAGEESSMAAPSSANRKKLIFCFLGIFISYFVYGILQEKM